jgi:acetoin utilization protein AcuB
MRSSGTAPSSRSGSSVPNRVRDVMTTQVTTVAPETLVAEAIQLFGECNIRHLLVTDQEGKLAGVFSDRDALRQMARGCDPFATRVAALMRQEPVTVAVDTTVQDAIELLSFHRINCLPVIDADRRVQGVLTTTDLLTTLYRVLNWLDAG